MDNQLDLAKYTEKMNERIGYNNISNIASPTSAALKDAMSSRSRDSANMKNVYISNKP